MLFFRTDRPALGQRIPFRLPAGIAVVFAVLAVAVALVASVDVVAASARCSHLVATVVVEADAVAAAGVAVVESPH